MDFKTAQDDLSAAYVGGAPGVLVSGLVWFVAGGVWLYAGLRPGFFALFFGGMAIVPLGLAIARALRAPKVDPGNPLQRLGLESTFILFAGILIAYGLLRAAPALVFPVMAITIGARYFVFRTLYDEPLFWALAAALIAVGGAAVAGVGWPGNLAFVVGAVEVLFWLALFRRG